MDRQTPTNYSLPALTFCLLIVWPFATTVFAQNMGTAKALQAEGIKKFTHWLDHKRSTGDVTGTMDELAEAESNLQSSLDLFLKEQDYAGAAWSAIKLGSIKWQRSEFDRAGPIYQKAIELAEKAKRSDYETLAMARLAQNEQSMERIDASKEHSGRAVKLGAACGNRTFYFEALYTASEVAVKLGDLAGAADLLDRAFAVASEVDHIQLYRGHIDRAEIYYKRVMRCIDEGKYDALCRYSQEMARKDYQQAIAIAQELGYPFLSRLIQEMMQDFIDKTTQLAQLIEHRDQHLAFYRFMNPIAPEDVTVSESFATGSADPSTLAFYKTSVKEMQDWRSRMQQQGLLRIELDSKELFLQGILAEAEGDNEAALVAYRHSVDLVEQDRRNLQDERERGAFLEDKISYYYRAALLLLDRKDYSEAFSFFERSRARAMADMLASRPPDLGTAQERSRFGQLQTMRANIGAMQGKVFDLIGSTDQDQHLSEIVRLQKQIAESQEKYQELEIRIAHDSPKLAQLTTRQPTTLESVQRSAREGGYDVLYYVIVEPNVVLWHINGNSVHVRKVFMPADQLTTKIAALQEAILARKHNASAIFDQTISRQLFLFLVQPVLSFVTSNRLVIIPHEQLNSIPFQVLQNPEDQRFLGESFAISYGPSATVLSTLQALPNLKNGRLLAIADPLMHNAQDEVESIGRLYPHRSKVVSRAPVTKTDVNTWVADYDLVHLSVHGKFDKKDPLLSYLQFERIPTEDGRIDNGHLTAAEMFGLPLQKNSLIILSACETGQVEASQANELLGMERSLLYAGAGDLVLSLWQVDAASTKLWMETFYEKGRNMPPAEAAKEALLAVKSHPEYSHPLYWAPFVMTGK